MVGSNGTMIAIRLVRSKLRKREEHHSNVVHPETATVVQTATVSASSATISTIVPPTSSQLEDERCSAQVTIVDDNSSPPPFNGVTTITTATTTTITTGTNVEHDDTYANATSPDQFVWQFPPPSPPPQYTLYNDQDALVHTLPAGRPGFAKGLRKNFGGHWRRLVKRKPETETCAIPPELKDQLKTIYVY